MKIAILGSSGVLGKALVMHAEARGHEVVRGSRTPDVGGAIVIDARNTMKDAREVLVEGTKRLLAQKPAHYVGISIVGIDDAPLEYYRVKLAQENVIEGSANFSLLRATQFHDLVPVLLKRTIAFVPTGWKLQPIDTGEVALALVEAAEAGPRKRLPDMGGPEILDAAKLARMCGSFVVPVPLFGKTGAYLRSGKMCAPDRAVGKITFAEWLEKKK